jgi:hypothetical protein
MSANAKKSMTATIALILFGALALFAGREVAVGTDSRCRAGVVWSRSKIAQWPELTPRVTIEDEFSDTLALKHNQSPGAHAWT